MELSTWAEDVSAYARLSDPPVVNWDRIENFVGFGRVDAPVVFIGMEEGLKDADALLEDLAIRSTYETPVMDLKEAHRGIAGTERYFDPDRAPRQPTWRVMADLMLRRGGNDTPTGADRRRYRALELGRSHGDTLLTELLPYPHPKRSDWLYKRFGKYDTRADYTREMLSRRRTLLRSVIAAAPRQLIVCYGKVNWPEFEDLFDDVIWSDVGPFRVGGKGSTRIVLTTHFSGYGFNTESQLQDLANVALRKTTGFFVMTEGKEAAMSAAPLKVGPPNVFDTQEMSEVEDLIRSGEEVDVTNLPKKLENAQVIAIKRDDHRAVAVAVLKQVRIRYNETLSDNAHSGYPLDSNATEVGYIVSVQPGAGGAVTRAVLEHGQGTVFATVRTDNPKMRATLEHSGFVEVPKMWASREHPGKQITLWVRKPSA
jgi:hypothetical protein